MGLSIGIETKTNLPQPEEVEAKLKLAVEVLEYQKAYFSPKALESWSMAPLESLGGKLLERVPKLDSLESLFSHGKFSITQAPWESHLLTFRILGDWNIGKARVSGYLTLHNKEWRSTYGDIESNVYPTTQFSDLIHLIRTNHDAEAYLISDFLREFPKIHSQSPKVNRIYFGFGVPSKIDVDSLIGAYYSSETAFIKDCISTAKEVEGKPIKDSFEPYRESFLVSGLKQVPSFDTYLDDLFGKHSIKKDTTGSITLLGSDTESFKLLFEEISKDILRPIADQLPNNEAILGKIRDAVVEKTTKQTKLSFG